MAAAIETELASYCDGVSRRARAASQLLAGLSGEIKNRWLIESARQIEHASTQIAAANAVDLVNAPQYGLTDAEIDRLKLTPDRILQIANGLREIASLPDPIGEVIDGSTRPNGLQISKIRVPLGVVFFIYESRPNVTADAAALVGGWNSLVSPLGTGANSGLLLVNTLKASSTDINPTAFEDMNFAMLQSLQGWECQRRACRRWNFVFYFNRGI
jgi:glutamate-5-semialdehyde dehydrogenase